MCVTHLVFAIARPFCAEQKIKKVRDWQWLDDLDPRCERCGPVRGPGFDASHLIISVIIPSLQAPSFLHIYVQEELRPSHSSYRSPPDRAVSPMTVSLDGPSCSAPLTSHNLSIPSH
jgi:hypothetical protein